MAHPSFATPSTVIAILVGPMLANSLAVHGIFELVMHLRMVLDEFVLSEPAKALAVRGYFQSSVTELGTRDIVWFGLVWFEEGL